MGGQPEGLAYDSIHDSIFVANPATQNVSVISGATRTVATSVFVGGSPVLLTYDNVSGQLFVSNLELSANVSVIDTRSDTYVASIAVPQNSIGLTYDPLTQEVWVAGAFGELTAISTVTDTVVGALLVAGGVEIAAFDPTSGDVYVTDPAQGTLLVLAPGNTTPPAAYPVTFSETGLPNGAGWSVTVNRTAWFSDSNEITLNLTNGSYTYALRALIAR